MSELPEAVRHEVEDALAIIRDLPAWMRGAVMHSVEYKAKMLAYRKFYPEVLDNLLNPQVSAVLTSLLQRAADAQERLFDVIPEPILMGFCPKEYALLNPQPTDDNGN